MIQVKTNFLSSFIAYFSYYNYAKMILKTQINLPIYSAIKVREWSIECDIYFITHRKRAMIEDALTRVWKKS